MFTNPYGQGRLTIRREPRLSYWRSALPLHPLLTDRASDVKVSGICPFHFNLVYPMKITREEVEHVARLARLELGPDEMERITGQLDTLLSYVAKLDEVDTTGVAVTTCTGVASNGFREDVVTPSLLRESALAGAPQHNGEFFVVPRILT